jgi:TolB-like protein
LKKGLAEMLITDVSGDPSITVVERNRLEEVIKELELQQTAKIDAATAQRVGKLLGAQYLVTGSLISQKASGRLDAHVVRVETGEKLSMDNAVKYSQALDAIDKKDKKTAQEKLQQVVKAQPDFMLATLELDRLMK